MVFLCFQVDQKGTLGRKGLSSRDVFRKAVNYFRKRSILDVLEGSENTSNSRSKYCSSMKLGTETRSNKRNMTKLKKSDRDL